MKAMSDQDLGKKIIEEEEFYYFLEAYEYATNDELSIDHNSERPDFICNRANGEKVGFELTKILFYKESAHCILIAQNKKVVDPYKAMELIYLSTERKNKKLYENNWQLPNNTVLVLQLMDWTISELMPFITEGYLKDFQPFKFSEIWLADFTGVEAFGNVELLCFKPQNMQGYCERPNPLQKPYG